MIKKFFFNNNKKFIFSFLFLFFIFKYENNDVLKICLCTIGKKENLYIREFVSYYRNYGVDKIYIYDNNDNNDEKFESILKDYIQSDHVEIIDIRNKEKPQIRAIQDCINKNYNKYNWLIIYDIDEFIYLKNFKNIKDYLKQKKFMKCQNIQLNHFSHTDNNLLYYNNKSIKERFRESKRDKFGTLKSILKGNIKIDINGDIHNINNSLISCNGFGEFNKNEKYFIFTKNPDYTFYYIDHYPFKSTIEFIKKINKGSVYSGNATFSKYRRIKNYFKYNALTLEKINLIEKYTKLNLSKYK